MPFSPPQPEAPLAPPSADPFAPLPESHWKKETLPPPPIEMPIPTPESKAANAPWNKGPDNTPPVSSFMLAEPDEAEKPVSPFPAILSQAEAPKVPTGTLFAASAAVPPVVIPANPVTGAPEVISAPPVSPVKITLPHAGKRASAPTRASAATNSTRSLLLTVLLGSPEAEDVDTFVNLTRQLPGVAAAVCLHQGNTLASQGDGTTGADRFIREASANAKMLPALAALTGIADTDTLHIQSGQAEATFCLHDDVVLAVLHNPDKRETVLREKITLLGRELAAIVREREAA
jgi:hypothetical protein